MNGLPLKIVHGFIVARRARRKNAPVEYANGAGAFVPERRRAFIFTTQPGCTHDTPSTSGGRTWARQHRAHLLETLNCDGYRVYLIRIVSTA